MTRISLAFAQKQALVLGCSGIRNSPIHVSFPALAVLGGTLFLDTFAVHELNYSLRCWE